LIEPHLMKKSCRKIFCFTKHWRSDAYVFVWK